MRWQLFNLSGFGTPVLELHEGGWRGATLNLLNLEYLFYRAGLDGRSILDSWLETYDGFSRWAGSQNYRNDEPLARLGHSSTSGWKH